MAIPFKAQAVLDLPGGPALPNDPISALVSQLFESQVELRLSLAGSGTKVVDMGTVSSPGAKLVFVMVEPSSTAAPVLVRINGAVTGGTEISAGGFMMVASPSPVTGITLIDLVHTTAVTVRLWVLA